jgi:hypothetical protein
MSLSVRLAENSELRAGVGIDVIELGVVCFADFSRDVKAESRTACRSRKKRLEELSPQVRGYARPIVYDIQSYSSVPLVRIDDDTNASFLASAVPRCVSAQVPHDLIQVATIE